MKFNFRKIASVLTGAVMLSSTVALAAAANYPAPFVQKGNADVAIVYGSMPGADVDLLAVTDITNNLQVALAKQTATSGTSTTSASISGEAAAVSTSGTKIYVNDSLNTVKTVLTKTELPTILADGSISANVDATYTQTIDLGSNPQVTFGEQPTSEDDPAFGLALSTTAANYIYNSSVTFNKAVNFTHSDTKGEDITLFGQKFTVASATDTTNLVLLKTAEKVSLTSDAPSSKVTIAGKEYTVELISASDSSATVKVTDADGNSETKEVSENASKKIQGVTIAVTNADETNLKLSASVIAGAEKITLADGQAVTYGEDAKTIDGTRVYFNNGTAGTLTTTAVTKISISVYAPSSDTDAIIPGSSSFKDPVFGTFKVDFASLNIPENSTAREEIRVRSSGDDKVQVTFTPQGGSDSKTVTFAKNYTSSLELQSDNDGHNITVVEQAAFFRNDYVVVGNEETGHLLKLTTVTNQSSGYSNDKVTFSDVLTGDTVEATLTSEGAGTLTVGGKSYNIVYSGDSSSSEDARSVRLNYPDSSGTGDAVFYPTVETKLGAKIAFYEPITVNVSAWDGTGYRNLTTMKFPDGDGYTDVAIASHNYGNTSTGANFTVGGTLLGTTQNNTGATVGKLTYNFTISGKDSLVVRLNNPQTGAQITDPALIIFEEKDDNSDYHALVVTLESGATSDDGAGVSDVVRTWGSDTIWDSIALSSNSKLAKEADLFGSIVTVDTSDSDQAIATISYPDEQVHANIYVAANAAEITGGETSSGSGSVKELGSILVKDSEVAQVANKNLIVVGGSCVNTLAAELLGGASCGASFEEKTGVTAGSFLIQSFSRTNGKIATLVAGYNAQDTVTAAKYLTTQTVDTTVGKKYKGTSTTTAELVTESNNTA